MEREELLMKTAREFLSARFEETLSLLTEEYQEKETQIRFTFEQSLQKACQKAMKKQNQGLQGKLAYLSISYLASSRITESYQFQISLFDQRFYLDDCEVCADWCPEFLFALYQKNQAALSSFLEARVPRIRTHELDRIASEHIKDYYALTMEMLRGFCRDLFEGAGWEGPEWEENPRILYGGYMDAFYILYPKEEEGKRDEIFSDSLGGGQ